jgi:hypothetical protein
MIDPKIDIDQVALELATRIARQYNVTDAITIARYQVVAIETLKYAIGPENIPCTCLSELQCDAYEPGGPMSGKLRPPPCKATKHRR